MHKNDPVDFESINPIVLHKKWHLVDAFHIRAGLTKGRWVVHINCSKPYKWVAMKGVAARGNMGDALLPYPICLSCGVRVPKAVITSAKLLGCTTL